MKDYSDLVTRLLDSSQDYVDCSPHCDLEIEAAEAIKALQRDAMRYHALRAANNRPPDEVDRVVDASIAQEQSKVKSGVRKAIQEYPH